VAVRVQDTAQDDSSAALAAPGAISSPGSRASGAAKLAADAWHGWRQWQLSRPFGGAILMILAGIELLMVLWWAGPARVPAGAAFGTPVQLLLASGLIFCGLLTLLQPVHRILYSAAAILLAICAVLTPDIGGYVAGALLGAAGGALSFSWVPQCHPRGRVASGGSGGRGVPRR
jgi:CDP-diglyceride synthetase